MKKNYLISAALVLSLAFNVFLLAKHLSFFHGEKIYNLYEQHICTLSPEYKRNKKIIKPYFDEKYYILHYKDKLMESGLTPIDHFLQRGVRRTWRDHCDPNDWFNVTLYKERLWPNTENPKENPFANFLKQPKQTLSNNPKNIEIFVKDSQETYRSWMAAEAFLRTSHDKIIIRLSPKEFKEIPVCFKPQIQRGLIVLINNKHHYSFYKSDFITHPKKYNINVQPYKDETFPPMKLKNTKDNHSYVMHSFYSYSDYENRGLINPLLINFGKYVNEPIWSFPFAHNVDEYKRYMNRIAPGYDLVFTGLETHAFNECTVPGFMCTFLTDDEVKEIDLHQKTYSVGFLLSLGHQAGNNNYRMNKTENYYMREFLWKSRNRIKMPKQFYVSRETAKNYSADYQPYVMPTRSKKWVYNSQFYISIENCKQRNYFTEKIISCFTSLVIPIYIGCPNITDYFDERGMFIANDIDDVVRICNSITPETYANMLPYLLENKKRAEKLLNLEDNSIDKFFSDIVNH